MVDAFEDFGRRTASPGSGEFVNIRNKVCNKSPPCPWVGVGVYTDSCITRTFRESVHDELPSLVMVT